MKRSEIAIVLVLILGFVGFTAQGAPPPDRMNYQGVLRDAADAPLDGSYDMVFRFWSAENAGDEILVDRHVAANTQAVTVDGGLFSVQLGSGEVLDGSGPGDYTSLAQVFADYGDVWLEVEVGSETLSPRIPVASAGYALNAGRLEGRAAQEFLDTSTTQQSKASRLTIDATGQQTYGIESYGDKGGGYFKDTNSSGYAYVGNGDNGIRAYGNYAGGYFKDLDSTGYAYIGFGDEGVRASGSDRGAYFADSDQSGYANVGIGNRGIEGFGTEAGGYFQDTNSSGYAYVGYGDNGIRAYGNYAGGYFKDLDSTGYAYIAFGNDGIRAYGNNRGAYFADSDQSGYANVGIGDRGIEGFGSEMGGYFKDSDNSGYAYVGYGDRGIEAYGSEMGGYFKDLDSTGYAYIGFGDDGIRASGSDRGGYFQNANDSGYAYVARGDGGILGYGNAFGGYFYDRDGGTFLYAGRGSSSTSGNGAKNFVQNHPYEPSRKIVYTSLEGNEAGTYTRGSARLEDGRAVIALDETFAWVTNPDIGLTAHVTARGSLAPLAVESMSTSNLVVIGENGSDAIFDYIVYGLRIGFEEIPVVQPKDENEDAPIPSMASHRELLAEQPELRATTPLERFREMNGRVEGIDSATIDLSRARALIAAIHEFDPETDIVDATESALRQDESSLLADDGDAEAQTAERRGRGSRRSDGVSGGDDMPDAGIVSPITTVDAGSASDRPQLPPGVVMMAVSGAVEPGDLLVLDSERPGALRPADSLLDPNVVGVAAGAAQEAESGTLEVPVSAAGIVEAKVDAGYGAIRPGDLLVSSSTPGHAMRTLEVVPGTIVGKALETLELGTGTIRVLLMAR